MKKQIIHLLISLFITLIHPMPADASSTIKVFEIDDHILAFYDGRDPTGKRVFSADWNWEDDAAMKLGVATYVIYSENKAIVYDTFPSIQQALWVRNYLELKGIKQFTVVLSHWHPDHIAGNAVYKDCNIIATTLDREILLKNKAGIEAGKTFGPPGISPLILPNIDYVEKLDLYLDNLKLELHHINIHSADSSIVYIPAMKVLLAGDTLEDPITYITDPGSLTEHIRNLRKLNKMNIDRIYPNHGDPAVIAKGGYHKTFIEATLQYLTKIINKAHENDYLKGSLKEHIGESVSKGWIHYFEPYESIHQENLKQVHAFYQNKPLPQLNER